MNKPVAWAIKANNSFIEIGFDDDLLEEIEQMYVMEGWKYDVIPLYTQDQLEEARKIGMQQERALWNLSESTQEIMNTHPVKELTDEEILEIVEDSYMPQGMDKSRYTSFARAILRKAQEK